MKKTTLSLFAICLLAIAPCSLHAQWTKTNGLSGGSTGGFLNYGDTIIANMGNELYFSSNNGQTWTLMPNANGVNLLTAYTDGQRILGSRYDAQIGLRLTISDDFGQSWRPVASADTMLFYDVFLAYGYIYGSDNKGLYRTNDDGVTWEYVTHQFIGHPQFDGQHITGKTTGKVIQSTDGGFTWNILLQFIGNSGDVFQHENFLFLKTGQSKCFSSSDYGQTWNQFTSVGNSQASYYFWHNGSIYGLNSTKVRKSSDLGQTWEDVPLPATVYYPAFRGVSADNAIIIGGIYNSESGSLLRSTDDGATWFQADAGIHAASGKLRSIDNKLFAASQSGLFQLNADGLNWTKQHPSFTPGLFDQPIFSDYVKSGDNLLFSNGNSAWVSLDGGQSWSESFLASNSVLDEISEMEIAGNNIFGWGTLSGSNYYWSQNNGISFQTIPNVQIPYMIRKLVVDQGKVYIFASDKNIYRSDDFGAHWVLQSSNIPTDLLFLDGSYGLTFSVAGDAMLLNAGSHRENSVFSNDGGQSWTYYDGATAGLPWSATYPSDLLRVGNYLLLGTKEGVFSSQNNGTDWLSWNEGMVQKYITNMELHDGYLWAGTRDGGIWKRAVDQLGTNVSTKDIFDENATDPDAGISALSLVPNPATDMVLVETGGQAGELMVQDGTGRVVLRKFISGSNASFPVAGLPNGLYQVVFLGEKAMQHKQLAVLH